MCNQCPTVGEFICGILNCGRCNHTCHERHACKCEDRCEHRCNKCEREAKRYECFCREKKEYAPCDKPEKEHDKSDCCCKFY